MIISLCKLVVNDKVQLERLRLTVYLVDATTKENYLEVVFNETWTSDSRLCQNN